jgi:predicted nucleotidyltransferase
MSDAIYSGPAELIFGCVQSEDRRSHMTEGPKMSETLPLQREQVRELAKRCAHVLHTRFGARRVVPFGSVVENGQWHARSDLDLAVEGLAPEQFFHAWASLRAILPAGLELDLVALEDVSAEMRARILGERTMSEDPRHELRALVQEELTALQRIVQDVQSEVGHLADPPSQFALNALASYLHQFYTGCERIFERLAVHIDGTLPGGAFSHVNLLAQMARDNPDRRPAVLDETLWLCLQDYLAFRHFFRHAYGYTLEWAKLHPLIDGMSETLDQVRTQLMTFFDNLA